MGPELTISEFEQRIGFLAIIEPLAVIQVCVVDNGSEFVIVQARVCLIWLPALLLLARQVEQFLFPFSR